MSDTIRRYISTLDGKHVLATQPETALKKASGMPDENTIVIDPTKKHQPILGFGSTLMDTDIYNLTRMSYAKQQEVLHALFDEDEGAGWNFMRIPFGSSDWERDSNYYTYDDIPQGMKDWNLEHFSIQRDIDRGLPDIMRRIRSINPDVLFMASVWGVPGWMKDNDNILFGRFSPECTDVYARYLRMAVQAWKEQGIEIYAITTQNEPLTGEDRATPTCRFTWRLQAPVLKALKKEFDAFGIKTQIWCYDHNFDTAAEFIEPLLNDSETYGVIDGAALHDYSGSPRVMGKLQETFPDMGFYMTERRVDSPSGLGRMIEQFHNGSRSYIQWVTMTDEYGCPHQFLGNPLIYNEPQPVEHRSLIYNYLDDAEHWEKGRCWALYTQFTRFVRRGMLQVDSSYGHKKWVTTAAFQHPDGEIALVAVNQTDSEQAFKIRIGGSEHHTYLPSQAVATYLIHPGELALGMCLPVSSAPAKTFIEPPAFDLELTEILLDKPVKAGQEAVFKAQVTNVGNAPTPKGCPLFVYFGLDGDLPVGRSVTVPPVIQPGHDVIVTANFPFGKKTTWTAEAGYHFISAQVTLGNTFREQNNDNNHIIREFYFE